MDFSKLIQRDIKKTLNLRTLLIWIALSGISIFFFFTSNGKHELLVNNNVDFMSLFLPQIIFGAWAVLSVYFDLVSADREHNVLDCILCSGVSKSQIFISKTVTTSFMSLILSLFYLIPITFVIMGLSGSISHISVLLRYLLPLWGYIMVFAALGVLISVVARSSKAALIWSLASGLILMPRFFMILVDGIGGIFHWTQEIKDTVSLIAPGIMMEALSDFSNPTKFITAAISFSSCIIVSFTIAYLTFIKQDEYNYGG